MQNGSWTQFWKFTVLMLVFQDSMANYETKKKQQQNKQTKQNNTHTHTCKIFLESLELCRLNIDTTERGLLVI